MGIKKIDVNKAEQAKCIQKKICSDQRKGIHTETSHKKHASMHTEDTVKLSQEAQQAITIKPPYVADKQSGDAELKPQPPYVADKQSGDAEPVIKAPYDAGKQ